MRFTATWSDVATLTVPFIFILLGVLLVGELKPVGVIVVLAWGMWYALRIGYRKGIEYAADEMRETLR